MRDEKNPGWHSRPAATEAQLHGQQYAFDRMNSYLPALFASQDAMEGVMAVMQKRPTKFQGK